MTKQDLKAFAMIYGIASLVALVTFEVLVLYGGWTR